MVIEWTDKAKRRLSEIFYYYQKVAGEKTASKIRNDIWSAAGALAAFPHMAAVEPVLSEFPETFRSLVVKEIYKIVYYVVSVRKLSLLGICVN
jgi:plasmid stabilization system protein ParE